jgi:Tfp pilus assembly protein PilN
MRTYVNLSRRPFINHRLFWIALVAVYFIGLWMVLWIGSERNRVLAKQTEIKQRVEGQRAAYDDVIREQQRQKEQQQKIFISEEQKLQLASARQLIQRKSFSWNRMLSDLEAYVPKTTRIMSIKVDEIANAGEGVEARVEVKAIGTTAAEMTEMMANLEKSGGLFAVGNTGQETMTENGETPFTLTLTYNPARGGGR